MTDTPPALAEALFDAVGLLRRRSRRFVGTPFPELGLSGAQIELVRAVRRNPGLSVAEAAEMLGLAPNTVSTLVGQLVGAGVMSRGRDGTDRRVARLTLTPAADAQVRAWRDRRGQATNVALQRLSPEEHAALARALPVIERLADALADAVDEPVGDDDPAATALVEP